VTMVWATVAEVRAVFAAQQAALGDVEWPPLPEADAAVQVLVDSATRHLAAKVIRWPILDDTDRAEDTEQRGHIVQAVAETIRARLASKKADDDAAAQLGSLVGIVSGGGRIKAGNLEVQGGAGVGAVSKSRIPLDAIMCLQAAGLIGGSVAKW
jgi:hypothetical protein